MVAACQCNKCPYACILGYVALCLGLCLQDFPAKWIYEPWKAPIADQKQAHCRIGVDYPKPMVDHAVVSKENIQKLKEAYTLNSPTSKTKSPSHARPAAARATPSGGKQATIPVGMFSYFAPVCVLLHSCHTQLYTWLLVHGVCIDC